MGMNKDLQYAATDRNYCQKVPHYLKVLFNCCFLAIYSETQQVTCSAVFNEYA